VLIMGYPTTPPSEAGGDKPPAPVLPEIAQWTRTAARVLNAHTKENGECACCHDTWPCPAVCRADMALAGW